MGMHRKTKDCTPMADSCWSMTEIDIVNFRKMNLLAISYAYIFVFTYLSIVKLKNKTKQKMP